MIYFHSRNPSPSRPVLAVALFLTFLVLASANPDAALAQPRLVVGEPVHVSHARAEVPHVEPYLAAHPDDPAVLVGAAVTLPGEAPELRTTRGQVYRSADGGATWQTASAPGCRIDPWLVFDATGEVYLLCLSERDAEQDAEQDAASDLVLLRSRDRGRSWQETDSRPPGDRGVDRPVITVDGKGVLHLAFGEYFAPEGLECCIYGPVTSRSADGGASFTPPVRLAHDNLQQQPIDVEVLSDGSPVVLFTDYAVSTAGGQRLLHHRRSWIGWSPDGGDTFAPPLLAWEQRSREAPWSLAVDRSERHRDRLYLAVDGHWSRTYPAPGERHPEDVPALFVVHSDDAGRTWSEPVTVTSGPGWAHAEVPAVEVNGEGLVGVAWYDTRHDPGATCFDVYFTVSLDGGESFLPEVRVTPETSCPRTVEDHGAIARRWAFGGDYSGLAAGADGTFHLLWADTRSGVYQLWSAAAEVEQE